MGWLLKMHGFNKLRLTLTPLFGCRKSQYTASALLEDGFSTMVHFKYCLISFYNKVTYAEIQARR
jgi:hypothetical protein